MLTQYGLEGRAGGQDIAIHQQEGFAIQGAPATHQPRADAIDGILQDVLDVQPQMMTVLEVGLDGFAVVIDHDQQILDARIPQGGSHVLKDRTPRHPDHRLGPGLREGEQSFAFGRGQNDGFHAYLVPLPGMCEGLPDRSQGRRPRTVWGFVSFAPHVWRLNSPPVDLMPGAIDAFYYRYSATGNFL